MLSSIVLFLIGSSLSTLSRAQDTNPAFFYHCRPGVWALTFDDGPSPETERLLGYLDAAAIKVTFFIQGDKLANASWAAQTKIAFEKGHQIASHTYSHPDLNTLTVAQIQKEMDTNSKLLKDLIGVTPHYMRPPFGNCNAQCADFMKQNEYGVVEWSVDSNDWKFHDTPDKRPEVLTNMQKDELINQPVVKTSGYISLQHDTEFFSVDYVPQIIANIKEQGFTFSTVQECFDNPPFPKYREAVNGTAAAPSGAATTGATTPPSPTGASSAGAPSSAPTAPAGAPAPADAPGSPTNPTANGSPASLEATDSLASPSLRASFLLGTVSAGLITLLLLSHLSPI